MGTAATSLPSGGRPPQNRSRHPNTYGFFGCWSADLARRVLRRPPLGHLPAADTVLKEDSRGARLAKQHKDPKRIDAAVAAVMAFDRAAILAGEVGPAIYVLD